jgi:TetR/AcrR family transcriptional regulator, mexJK operon transcriptional repressor
MSLNRTEKLPFRRGPGGRPTQKEAERRHRRLLQTATRMFLLTGFDRVSIEAIAQEAGVAKRFIYARYADKAELFVAGLERLIEERTAPLQTFEVPQGPAELGLFKFAKWLLDLALSKENLSFYRAMVIGAPRFPKLAKLDNDRSRHPGIRAIARILQTYADRGEIALEEPEMSAELFVTLVVQGPRHRALILGREAPAQEERRLKKAVSLFLDGCRARRPVAPGRTRKERS